jgi:cell division protein FtsN
MRADFLHRAIRAQRSPTDRQPRSVRLLAWRRGFSGRSNLPPAVNAILLTVFVGFLLVALFIVLFLRFRRDAETSSAERDSLLPLEDETPRLARKVSTPADP